MHFLHHLQKVWILCKFGYRGKSKRLDFIRHNFATRTLLRWAREGKDFEAYLPYLSTYMGHANFHSSYYYVHLLPEKLAVLDFMGNNGIIPEVPDEE